MPLLPPEFRYLDGKILSSRVYPEFFSLSPSDRVLNAGFGDGPQALVYRGRFASMVGIDIQEDRLARARRMLAAAEVPNVELKAGNVEETGEPAAAYDAVLAIDIIEHVQRPDAFVAELFRVLKPGGRLLITFPALHDRFEDAMSALGRVLKPWKKRAPHPEGWHPDHHAHEHPVDVWAAMVANAGFVEVRRRATTMFPPLHLYGVPRFWFSWGWLHALDRRVASWRPTMRLGQTVMVEFRKPVA